MTDLPTHIKGDTFDGVQFTMLINGSPADLTGATIRMDVREKPKTSSVLHLSTDNGGMSIITPTSGIFQINEQIVDIPAKTYVYDIETTFSSGDVKTYIAGSWIITQDVTYG